jgi:hypothetical protein
MRARNLLFVIVCLLALGAFKASVFPSADSASRPVAPRDSASIAPVVERLDASFDGLWREHNVQPADAAPDTAIARRISLALTGTIPSLEELRRFDNLPPDGRTNTWLAERLADRRYADYVAERMARAYVGVEDGPFLLYRRRRFVAWLADQLAANVPYDQVVRHLIADSGLWTDTPATNFVTVTIQPDQYPDANQLAARVSRAFLGTRIDCAECHDHPFEAWKQRDFQGLAAFFGQTRQSLRGIRDVAGDYQVENRKSGEMETIDCGVPFAKELLPDSGTSRERLAAWVTHPENRAFSREAVNRAWALLFGRPLVEPIDNLPSGAKSPPALDILADDFTASGYDWRRLLQFIVSTKVFQLDSKIETSVEDATADERNADDKAAVDLAAVREADWAVFPLTRLRPEQVVGALLQSASLSTIDSSSHILVRFGRAIGQNEFVQRYGDSGADEFDIHGGTIPQRLLMMNGKIVQDKTKDSVLTSAAAQIAAFAPDDDAAVETAILAVLTRGPTERERTYFVDRLHGVTGSERRALLGDLYWTLLNSTEFSWNH